MFSTKIRTTLAVLAATFVVGGAAVPAAQARPNDGRYQNSSEALRKKQEEANCGGLQAMYDILHEGMDQAQEAGKWKSFSEYRRAADSARREAFNAGCAWAQ